MKTYIIRGAFLNPFELQNYTPLAEKYGISAISSKHPISTSCHIPLIKLSSPTDLPDFPYKYPILNRLFTDAHILHGLEKTIHGADIVHVAETYYGYTHQAIMAKRRGEINKIISTVWETIPRNNESIKGRKQFKALARENIDHFIAVTQKAKRALVKEGVPEKKISVINMGIDISKFKPHKSIRNVRDINILCVARLVPEKGVTDLLKAFLLLRQKNQNIRLTFVGSGPLAHDMRGYKNVSIKQVPYSQIHREYKRANIFCLPSRATKTWEEQYGMCLVEAMASGLPIITTNTGAIAEVCGDSAIYFSHSNVEDLAANLAKLIYNKAQRDTLAKKARTRAITKFDRLAIAKQIGSLYQKILCRSK